MDDKSTLWYYFQNDQRIGPIDETTIQKLIKDNSINSDTLIWQEGMAGSLPLKSTPLRPSISIPDYYMNYQYIQKIKSQGSLIIIPRGEPYKRNITEIGELIKNKDYESLKEIRVEFPHKCLWCGSEQVTGFRKVNLSCKNSKFIDPTNRKVMNAGAIAGGVVAGALGANILGQGLVYQTIKPDVWTKEEEFTANITVPYCDLHTNEDCSGVVELVDENPNALILKMGDEKFANEIAELSDRIITAKHHAQNISDRLKKGTVAFSTLNGITWPDLCVVCGVTNSTEKIEYEIDKTKVTINACSEHGQISKKYKGFIKKVEKINNFYFLTFSNKQLAYEVYKLNGKRVI
jgi:hypothetical protein